MELYSVIQYSTQSVQQTIYFILILYLRQHSAIIKLDVRYSAMCLRKCRSIHIYLGRHHQRNGEMTLSDGIRCSLKCSGYVLSILIDGRYYLLGSNEPIIYSMKIYYYTISIYIHVVKLLKSLFQFLNLFKALEILFEYVCVYIYTILIQKIQKLFQI